LVKRSPKRAVAQGLGAAEKVGANSDRELQGEQAPDALRVFRVEGVAGDGGDHVVDDELADPQEAERGERGDEAKNQRGQGDERAGYPRPFAGAGDIAEGGKAFAPAFGWLWLGVGRFTIFRLPVGRRGRNWKIGEDRAFRAS